MNRPIFILAVLLLASVLVVGMNRRARTPQEVAPPLEPAAPTVALDVTEDVQADDAPELLDLKIETPAAPTAAPTVPRIVRLPQTPKVSEGDRLAMTELFGPQNQHDEDEGNWDLNPPAETGGGDFGGGTFEPGRSALGEVDVTPLPTGDTNLSPADVTPYKQSAGTLDNYLHPAPIGVPAPHINFEADMRDVVEHAGGAVQLRVDPQWIVEEQPIGREIRVLLLPAEADAKEVQQGKVPEGIWLTHHVNRSGSLTPEKLLQQRREEMGRNVETMGHQEIKLGGWPALLDDLIVGDERRIIIAVNTDWGLCEIHAWAPRQEFTRVWPHWEKMLGEIRIGKPRSPQHETDKAPLGLWKSSHGHLHLLADGRVQLAEDRAVAIGFERQLAKTEKPREPLVGKYQVDGDLLKIEWSDGSEMNIRWKVIDDQLRITDHLGRIARLRRIYF